MSNDRLQRLKVYAENLEARLKGAVPAKHAKSPETFKQMIEIDLRKTRLMIESLTK